MKRILFVLSILIGIQLGSQAQIINVPSDYPSIQQAIDTASIGDTILVANGTYLENIDFMGKAITVASEFIMDGDTSHISGTIIDGSGAPRPGNVLSTVLMQSGEDTTSILTGFTITGGSGTMYRADFTYRAGGGIAILNSGGNVRNNIIEGNRLYAGLGDKFGCGVFASVNDNHTAIIRDNIIRNNSADEGAIANGGGGIASMGGRIIIENNTIVDNILDSEVRNTGGGGITWQNLYQTEPEGIIEEVIIRNNLISGNQCYGPDTFDPEDSFFPWEGYVNGGGIALGPGFETRRVQIYNNIIRDNYTEKRGGGISSFARAEIMNNTIYNNSADSVGNSISLSVASSTILFNNLIWSEVENGKKDVHLEENDENELFAFNNLIKADSGSMNPNNFIMNTYLAPVFADDATLEFDPSSPAIGRGADSILVGSRWYHAPNRDYKDMVRPNPIDMQVDLGAFESAFSPAPQSSAELFYIGFRNRVLSPSFHNDTLLYSMGIADTFKTSPELELMLEDPLTVVDYRPAADLVSPDSFEDSTATLTITSTDGTVSKTYEIAFFTLSADATLKELDVSEGQLEPVFHPDTTMYRVILPCGSTLVPDVFPVPNLSESARVEIDTASSVNTDNKDWRTSYIRITPEAGEDYSKTYTIEFFVDETTPPSLTLLSDQVEENEDIGAVSTQSGKIYLVPVDTRPKLLYIGSAKLEEASVNAGDTVYFSSMDLDTTAYWLYAVNECNLISESVDIFINTSTVSARDIISSSPVLYPVPLGDRLFIKNDQSIHKVEIYNVHGTLEISSMYHREGIYTGTLQKGIHLIKIFTSDGNSYTEKIIKTENP